MPNKLNPSAGPRNYKALSEALWKHVGNGRTPTELSRLLGTQPQRIRAWEKGTTTIRSAVWCVLAKKSKISLIDLAAVILAPQVPQKMSNPISLKAAQTQFIGPLLRELRGERTLFEVQKLLVLGTSGAFHHWESGRRDIPFAKLLQAIDVLSSRLQSFCEALHFTEDLSLFGFIGRKADFSERFFSLPWTPTVFLALHTESYLSQKRHDNFRLVRQLKLTREQITEALKTLADLEMVVFDGKLYRPRIGQHYAPPTLTSEKLDLLHRYWFSRSSDLYDQPGLHKVEEHALSHESLKKIIGWITELRERIRAEVNESTPETVVHIHWQVADMLASADSLVVRDQSSKTQR